MINGKRENLGSVTVRGGSSTTAGSASLCAGGALGEREARASWKCCTLGKRRELVVTNETSSTIGRESEESWDGEKGG